MAKIINFQKEKLKREGKLLEFPEDKLLKFKQKLKDEGIEFENTSENYSEEEMAEIRKGNFFRPRGVLD